MNIVKQILKKRNCSPNEFYRNISKKIPVLPFTCETFLQWLYAKKHPRYPLSEHAWVITLGLKLEFNVSVSVTDILFPLERIAELEAKYLQRAA